MTTDSYELPEPFGFIEPTGRSPAFHFLRRQNEAGMPLFTADQMREYALLAVKAERERAARICEHLAENGYKGLKHPTATECAAAIRGA